MQEIACLRASVFVRMHMFKEGGPLSQLNLFVVRTRFGLWVTKHPLLRGPVFQPWSRTGVLSDGDGKACVCVWGTSSGSTLVQATRH